MLVIKSLTLLFIFSLSSNLFAATAITAPGASIPGVFAVSTAGKANYTIPIAIPPGTAGMQPTLALKYDSGAKSSYLGIGWRLTGLSSIHRCPKTVAQDGVKAGVSYSEADRFCLDGKRLTLISGEYGKPGSEYRTELETFNKVIVTGTAGTGPAYFTVMTKSGQILQYGQTADSRLEVNGTDTAQFWLLSSTEDRRGNAINISYSKNAAQGETYPARINYTSNPAQGLTATQSVRFAYEDRPDIVTRYTGASVVRQTQRLTAIQTYFEETLVKSYQLGYSQGHTGQSRLAQISECDASGNCKEPTHFNWRDGFTLSDVINRAIGRDMYSANGGFFKFIATGNFDGTGLIRLGRQLGTFNHFRDAIGYPLTDLEFAEHGQNLIRPKAKPYSDDYDNDGLDDLLFQGKTFMLFCRWKTETGFKCDEIFKGYKTHMGDFNGDGHTDVYLIGTHESRFCAGPSVALEQHCVTTNPDSNWKDNIASYARDFNGDGHTDLYLIGSSASYFCAGPGITQSNNCVATANSNWHDGQQHLTGDFNGDGYIDLYRWTPATGALHFCAGPGISRADNCIQTGTVTWSGKANLIFNASDFNADGIADIHFTANNWLRARSGGLGYSYDPYYDYWCPGPAISAHHQQCKHYSTAGSVSPLGRQFPPAQPQPPNLLTTITDGLGIKWQIKYVSSFIHSPRPDTRIAGGAFASQPQIRSINLLEKSVVTEVITSNGIGGWSHKKYDFQSQKVDGHRGQLGFAGRTVTDVERETVTHTDYRQDYPYIGRPEKITVTLKDKRQATTEFSYAQKPLNNDKNTFVYADKRITTQHKLTGDYLTQTLVNSAYDDYGNLTRRTTKTPDDGHQRVEKNSYKNDIASWLLGLKSQTSSTRSAPDKKTLSTSRQYFYNALGELTAELNNWIWDSDNATEKIGTAAVYDYDSYGNIALTERYAQGHPGSVYDTQRSSRTDYDSLGRFMISETNALGHNTQYSYDQGLGLIKSLNDANGLTTVFDLDGFGRPSVTHYADGTQKQYDYAACTGHGGNAECYDTGSKYRIKITEAGQPESITSYDSLGREVYSQQQGFHADTPLWARTFYDALGRITLVDDPAGTVETSYDDRNRVTQIKQANGALTQIAYDGFITRTTSPLLQTTTETVNHQGLLANVRNANDQNIDYSYDAHGNLIQVKAPGNVITSNTYDLNGHLLTSNDPSLGFWQYIYDGRGELQSQTDAKNQTINYQYDRLSRLISRQGPEQIASWKYDTAPREGSQTWLGLLASVSADNDTRRSYDYDAYGRTKQVTITTDGQYTFKQSYDSHGRPSELTYPSGFKVRQEYTDTGYASTLKNNRDGQLFWQAEAVNPQGQITRQTYGNGVVIEHSFHPQTGRMETVKSTAADGVILQDQQFSYDLAGNLKTRINTLASKDERYDYDPLNRLISSTHAGVSQQIDYDELGNISSKTGVGQYFYEDPEHPYALTSTQTGNHQDSFSYDANGNLETGSANRLNIDTLRWNARDQAIKIITAAGSLRRFQYDAEGQRIKQVADSFSLSYASNDLAMAGNYEKENQGGALTHRHYLTVSGVTVGEYLSTDSGSNQTHYYHTDHQGTLTEVSDEQAQLVSRFHTDAWGQQQTLSGSNDSTHRGYTGHEQLDDGFIHMNGRIYHAGLGRMMSADPFVQAPDNLQSYNRYSYVINNPLRYTDPSGYNFSCGNTQTVDSNGDISLGECVTTAPRGTNTYTDLIGGFNDSGFGYLGDGGYFLGGMPFENYAGDGELVAGLVPLASAAHKAYKAKKLADKLRKAKKLRDKAKKLEEKAKAEAAKGTPKPRTDKLGPNPKAEGPHTQFKTDPKTGKVTGYTEFDATGNPVKRFRGQGKPHGGTEPPFILEPKPGKGPGAPPKVPRQPRPDELPRGY